MIQVGPHTEASEAIHAEKYRGKGESFREAMNRVASALQDNHEHYMDFRDALLYQRFLPAGRVQTAMGSLKVVTAFNCFVSATIHDSFTDGPSDQEIHELVPGAHPSVSIMDAAKYAAVTMRQGGGIGYDFSTLRPHGDLIKGVQSTTDGPMAFAAIFDAVCRATSSAGNRRGAQMLVMRCDHPDIELFIRAKQCDKSVPYEYRPLRGFNISVGITNEFMECLAADRPFPLKFNGVTYREVDPQNLWEMIMRSTYDWAEPGVLFIDRINEMNNLWYCETIASTNPCGEQPLPPHGACLLGSFNLVKYLTRGRDNYSSIDYDFLKKDIGPVVRAMDNVIDRTKYPLPEQRMEARNKRRMGLGVTGLANALEACGAAYGSDHFLQMENEVLSFITRECYRASALLAKEKGAFPLYDDEKYLNGKFIKTLDEDTRHLIKSYGIRNSHLTSIAPTGTISFCADNVSSGLEPVFSYSQERRIIMPEGPKIVTVEDYGVGFLNVRGKRTQDVTPQEHVMVLCNAQSHIDSAVSKTCNVPTNIAWEDFKGVYLAAWQGGAKGCTTYRPAGAYDEVLKSSDKKEDTVEVIEVSSSGPACWIDPATGQKTGACGD